MKRSNAKITKTDLKKLLRLASNNLADFFKRNPKYSKPYEGKQVLVALCQGAALHYVDNKNGVKDFDVWFFYPKKSINLPYRRRGIIDFGKSKFGSHPDDNDFLGRRIDVLMRSDSFFDVKDPTLAIAKYLSKKNSKTSKLLAKKAAVGLYPDNLLGKVLWPLNS
jgi:hypothetical protein